MRSCAKGSSGCALCYEQQLLARRDAYVADIDTLLQEYRPKLARAQIRRLLVLGTDFDRMLSCFGLVGVPTVNASPMHLSDSDLRIINRIAEENKTRLLVVSADIPPAVGARPGTARRPANREDRLPRQQRRGWAEHVPSTHALQSRSAIERDQRAVRNSDQKSEI